MRKPLYEISHEYRKAYDDLFGDDALPEDAIRDTLSAIQGEFELKALNIAALIKNMTAEVFAMKDAEGSINERRKRLEKRIGNLENYLLINMQAAGLDNTAIESPEHFIKLSKCPVSVKIDVDAIIPDEYMRIMPEKKEPDKFLLKEALNNNQELKGVSLIQNVKLVIK